MTGGSEARAVIEVTETGLYLPSADVYLDPWRPVDRAIDAHADHARRGVERRDRIARWRTDKSIGEANTLQDVRDLAGLEASGSTVGDRPD